MDALLDGSAVEDSLQGLLLQPRDYRTSSLVSRRINNILMRQALAR